MDQDRQSFEPRSSFDSKLKESFSVEKNNHQTDGLSGLNRQQKFLIFVLLFLFGFVVIFVLVSLDDFLYVPVPQNNEPSMVDSSTTTQQTRTEEDLRSSDTDKDGLSDYDELYIWKTSPYLPDTDSDSLSDFVEVSSGTDPNCPQGKQCFGLTPTTPETGDSNLADQTVMPTAPEIRALILSQGLLTSEELASLTDEQLLTLYIEVSAKQKQNPDTTQPPTLEAEYTPEKIRALLIESGIPAQDLQDLTDDELMTFFREAIKTIQ